MGSSLSPNSEPQQQFKEVSDSESTTSMNVLAVISGVSIPVLETLQDVARSAPAPYLSEISSVALEILKAVQTLKRSKGKFKKLGASTCELVYAIHATCEDLTKDNKPLDANVEENLKHLLKSIKQIQNFIAKQLRRSRFSRFWTYRSDSREIQQYKDDFDHYLELFKLQDKNLTIYELAKRITGQKQADLSRRTSRQPSEDRPDANSVGSDFPVFSLGHFLKTSTSIMSVVTSTIAVTKVTASQPTASTMAAMLVDDTLDAEVPLSEWSVTAARDRRISGL
ncbi:hypothetical protein AAF712_014683 [Marasmius tenuissimus]|uniref:Fungal N-terminal domain-containing protein n=1 Tax=Marasmius tenuissimus TaxID=585030 RepID=A0ABR2ZAE2_9AGAR